MTWLCTFSRKVRIRITQLSRKFKTNLPLCYWSSGSECFRHVWRCDPTYLCSLLLWTTFGFVTAWTFYTRLLILLITVYGPFHCICDLAKSPFFWWWKKHQILSPPLNFIFDTSTSYRFLNHVIRSVGIRNLFFAKEFLSSKPVAHFLFLPSCGPNFRSAVIRISWAIINLAGVCFEIHALPSDKPFKLFSCTYWEGNLGR